MSAPFGSARDSIRNISGTSALCAASHHRGVLIGIGLRRGTTAAALTLSSW
jgi:hypothetical protein